MTTLCNCTCGDVCPLGKIGSMSRCTREERETAARVVKAARGMIANQGIDSAAFLKEFAELSYAVSLLSVAVPEPNKIEQLYPIGAAVRLRVFSEHDTRRNTGWNITDYRAGLYTVQHIGTDEVMAVTADQIAFVVERLI